MLLNRPRFSSLRIRGKLAALVVLPLLAIVGLSAGIAVSQISNAREAGNTVRSVDIASAIGGILANLQTERLESIGYLLGQASLGDVMSSAATVDEQASDLRARYGSGLPAPIGAALDNIAGLAPVRTEVAASATTTTAVLDGFRTVIQPLITATNLLESVDTSTSAGREVIALDALLQIDELTNESAALLLQLAGENADPSTGPHEDTLFSYGADRNSIELLLSRFTTYATPSEVQLQNVVTQALSDRVGFQFMNAETVLPAGVADNLSPPLLYPQMQSFVALGRFAEQKTATDVITSVGSRQDLALTEAYLAIALGLIVIGAVAISGVAIARSVAVPLARLTSSTNQVARQAERELMRVADDESDATEPIHFDPVHVAADDEIGDLARAFERISRTAVQLVGRQAASRRNVAQMFGHVGRRTQNLVGRQMSLIETLQRPETTNPDPDDLRRLDHLTSRLRRNAGSLVALSGASDQGAYFAPLPVGDIVRLALAQIEGYERIDVDTPADLLIAPGAINDLVLLIAELMENATSFSPPHTRVTVTAVTDPGRITIADNGIGLPPARLDEENARLAQRERLDLAPTEVLGLFVVGRLARRHRLRVTLTESPRGGVTVTIDIANIMHATPAPLGAIDRITAPTRMPSPVPALVGARAQLGTAPRLPQAPSLFDIDSLNRATRAIESGHSWNAFELPQPALTAGPRTGVPHTGIPQTGIPQTGDDSGDPEPTVTLEWSSADTGRAPEPLSMTAVPPAAGPGAVAPPDFAAAFPQAYQQAHPPAGVPADGLPSGRFPATAHPGEPVPAAATPTASGGLTRRVPGATIRLDQPAPADHGAHHQDPDAVLDLIQQFESGVARALRADRPVPIDPTSIDRTGIDPTGIDPSRFDSASIEEDITR